MIYFICVLDKITLGIPAEQTERILQVPASGYEADLSVESTDKSVEEPAVEGRITLRLGDATARIIQTGPAGEEGRRRATVSSGFIRRSTDKSDSSLVYVLTEWTVNRLFRESSYFISSF